MTDPITSYNRVAPPSDPESSRFHLDGELSKLERSTASVITAINALPDTYATIVDLDAEETARIAADALKASIIYVDAEVLTEENARIAADALKAPLASPAFTGTPTAPTATPATNSTQLATTAYVDTADALKANLASPTFTGTPAAPTPSANDNSTKLATTAYVDTKNPWTMVMKAADQAITTSTTLVDDSELQFAVTSGERYVVRGAYSVHSTDVGGLKLAVNGPTLSTGELRASTTSAAATAYDATFTSFGSAGTYLIAFHINFDCATTGTLKLRIAQLNSAGTSTFEAGSYIEYRAL